MAAENCNPVKMLALSQVAELFGVSEKIISAWDESGFLQASWRTPHGHRRWEPADVGEVLRHPETWPVAKHPRGDVSTPEIIRLRDEMGWTWPEIAWKLGMCESGIRKRYVKEKRRASAARS